MAPLPAPGELTRLTDREILLLTVQSVHDLHEDFQTLATEVRQRAPTRKEKVQMKYASFGGAAAGLVALLGFIGELLKQ